MKYIWLGAVAGILLLQWTGGISQSSVGGPLMIAFALFAASIGVAIHEAWTKKRGAIGWIVNIVVAIASIIIITPFAGMIMESMLSHLKLGTSLAEEGGVLMSFVLACMMVLALASSWCGIWLVNRWRK